MALAIGALLGALTGLALALAQVKLVRIYAAGKPEHIQQRAFDTIDQLKLTSFLGLPLIFSIIGYMLAVTYFG
ncbi:MAG: hypothetical protein MUF11_15720 [Beijerinckiaceae bacterium]|jgi:hypothetical protein|nr:hypothetical protein [Beijerinckiaceae bacterium]